MSEDLDQTAADYVLGIARGVERSAIESRLENDAALKARVNLWQEKFVALDLAAGAAAPSFWAFRRDYRLG